MDLRNAFASFYIFNTILFIILNIFFLIIGALTIVIILFVFFSEFSAREVINALLKKFKVADNSHKFALYERTYTKGTNQGMYFLFLYFHFLVYILRSESIRRSESWNFLRFIVVYNCYCNLFLK